MYRIHRNSSPVSSLHPLVTLSIDEHGGRTYAKAELRWGGSYLAGLGVAYRHPCDHLAGETGQELATARALSDLAEQVAAPRRVNA
jgi:Rv2632c-like